MRLQLDEVAEGSVYTQPITNYKKTNNDTQLPPSLRTHGQHAAAEIISHRFDLACDGRRGEGRGGEGRGGKTLRRRRRCRAACHACRRDAGSLPPFFSSLHQSGM